MNVLCAVNRTGNEISSSFFVLTPVGECNPVRPQASSSTLQEETGHILRCSAVSTLVVSQGEVGVVGGLWRQAVVEVLSTQRLVWIHRCHCLDQLHSHQHTVV